MTPSHFQFRKIINNRWQKQLWDILSLFFFHCFLYHSSLILGNGIIRNNYYQKKRKRGKNEDGTFSNRTRQAEKLRYKTESEKRFRYFNLSADVIGKFDIPARQNAIPTTTLERIKKESRPYKFPALLESETYRRILARVRGYFFVITFFNLRCLRTCARQSATVRDCIYALHVKCSLSLAVFS